MNKENFKKTLLRSWIACSDFFYNKVEGLSGPTFLVLATIPVFLFWGVLLYRQPVSHLVASFYQEPILQVLSTWFNLSQHPGSLPATFLVISLHTFNLALFVMLARPYLSKLMLLWATWYIGIHPSHLSWFGRLEYFSYILECTFLLSSVALAKYICTHVSSGWTRIALLAIVCAAWFPLNLWLGTAGITLTAAYFWPLTTPHCLLLFISYATTQITAIVTFLTLPLTQVFINLRRMLVALFGLGWIPSSQQWLRYGFLLFWSASLVGLFLHTTKRREAALLLAAVGTYVIPQLFISIHPAFVYIALPAFIAALGLLYENTGEADVRSVIKSLIIPIYASFLFNVIAMLIQA